jgi:N-acetylglucosamine-6-phosphate deacetylase
LVDRTIYTASRIFTGEDWLPDHAIIVKHGIIESILPVVSLPHDLVKRDFQNCFIAPAFMDIQIYGAGEKLLAAYPEKNSLAALTKYCRDGGAAWCLPTVGTNTSEIFLRSIDAVRDYWSSGGNGVLGLHLEGPWINPVKRGAHIELLIHPPTIEEAKELLEYGKDVIKMITLAPEVCGKEIIDLIRSYNIIVAAGHSNATYEEAIHGFDNGIDTVTHLYNAMSPLQHRAPGLVGATLHHDRITASIIPDGYHVDFAAISIAKQVMKERLFAITDAVTETTIGQYKHQKAGDKYESGGILSGSALTMQKALYNLVHYAGIELEEAIRMCSLYPARVMNLDQELGRIKTGYRADMVFLDSDLNVVSMT